MLLTMRRRNTTVFYFIALEMQLWKPPEGAEENSNGHIPTLWKTAQGWHFTNQQHNSALRTFQ